MTTKHSTREAWLTAAVKELIPMFAPLGVTADDLPPIRVSVGWPGGKGKKGSTIGQCWSPLASADQTCEIFISPVLAREAPTKVLATLAHELCHAADRNENGHKGRFRTYATGIGLEGKMTATTASEGLESVLEGVALILGEYPHGALLGSQDGKESHPKQSTRMLKLEAPDCCGYIVRTTAKWIAEGMPSCPHGAKMEVSV